MAIRRVSLRGAKRRKLKPCETETDYFEARIPGPLSVGKLYCTKVKSPEEAALYYDILQRYSVLGVIGEKPKAAVKLNFPEYSRSLQLESLRSDFDIRLHKEEAMESILRQAQAAAKNLPERLRRPTPVVGSPSPSNRSSSHQNVHGKPLVAKQDLPKLNTNQFILQKISELSHRCSSSYASKVIEREMLERKVADINENSGLIHIPEPGPNEFTDLMDRLKQLMTIDEKIPWILEMAEQGYKSEDSECSKLRKLIEDHNLKVIDKCLMDDDNDSSGRQRANEDERLPRLPSPQWSSDDWIYKSYGDPDCGVMKTQTG